MEIRLIDDLPYVNVTLVFQDRSIRLDRVVLDTGSQSTSFSTDQLSKIGLGPAYDDYVHQVRGIGGSEGVVPKRVDRIIVGEIALTDFEIEVGGLTYHPDLDGLLGFDFLLQTKSIIDLSVLEIRQPATD